MINPLIKPLLKPLLKPMMSFGRACYAPYFDGVAGYGLFESRAIDPDGDIDLEFWTASDISSGTGDKYLIGQSLGGAVSAREFGLFHANSGNLGLIVGGNITGAAIAGTFGPNELLRLTLIGNALTVYRADGTILRTATFNRGAVREPSAPTTLMGRTVVAGGFETVGTFGEGVVPFVRINGIYWPLSNRDSDTQLSDPDGNSVTLFNINSEDWQQIPCRLRP